MVLQSISKKQKIILLAVFLFCFFVQVIPVIRSGLHYSFGVGFWGPNGHDGVWHLSLINHISNPTKIKMPIFAGEYLKNYHPFFDILIAFLSKITFINSSLWLFQIFPIITTILYLYFSFLRADAYYDIHLLICRMLHACKSALLTGTNARVIPEQP